MGNLCMEPSKKGSQVHSSYSQDGIGSEFTVQYETTLDSTIFTISQGTFKAAKAIVLVNAHPSPLTVSPVVRESGMAKQFSMLEAPSSGEVLQTLNTGGLKYKYFLHITLPYWHTNVDVNDLQAKLYEVYREVLVQADTLKAESIVFSDLAIPPLQIPVALHAECLVGALTLYVEDMRATNSTCLKHITFINQDKQTNQRYMYYLQSKITGLSEASVKAKIRNSISEIIQANSHFSSKLLNTQTYEDKQQHTYDDRNDGMEQYQSQKYSQPVLGKIMEIETEKDENFNENEIEQGEMNQKEDIDEGYQVKRFWNYGGERDTEEEEEECQERQLGVKQKENLDGHEINFKDNKKINSNDKENQNEEENDRMKARKKSSS